MVQGRACVHAKYRVWAMGVGTGWAREGAQDFVLCWEQGGHGAATDREQGFMR